MFRRITLAPFCTLLLGVLLGSAASAQVINGCVKNKAEEPARSDDTGTWTVEDMHKAVAADPELVKLLKLLGDPNPEAELEKFIAARETTAREWKEQQASLRQLSALGTTKRLEILPLIDWYAKDESLLGESGVAYLVVTDNSIILFDVGLNEDDTKLGETPKSAHPSKLLRNMERLGVGVDQIDTIVISHNHDDHIGGAKWYKQGSFSLSGEQVDLTGKRAYTPSPMTYPGIEPVHAAGPMVIAPGVATTGTIPNAMFFGDDGRVDELALLVHVEGKGVVIIAGCGHQTMARVLERADVLIPAPIYGLVGGLHYPVTQSRTYLEGIGLHQRFGTGKPPWEMVTSEEVGANIQFLKKRNPGIVGLSPHDSCDASIEAFRESFGTAYRDVWVGERIVVQ